MMESVSESVSDDENDDKNVMKMIKTTKMKMNDG